MPPKQTLPDWAMPLMFGTLISVLAWIAVTLQSMSNTLAVAVTKVEDHDRRLSNLETLYMNKGGWRMGILPRTFKFKTKHNVMFRRLHRVLTVRLVKGDAFDSGSWYYEVFRLDGSMAIVPYEGTIAIVGRLVNFERT
jgi:hypothetical protein